MKNYHLQKFIPLTLVLVLLTCLASGCAGTQSSSVESSSTPKQASLNTSSRKYTSEEYASAATYLESQGYRLEKALDQPDEYYDLICYWEYYNDIGEPYISVAGDNEWVPIKGNYFCRDHHYNYERGLSLIKMQFPNSSVKENKWDIKIEIHDFDNNELLNEYMFSDIELSKSIILIPYVTPEGAIALKFDEYTPCEICGEEYERIVDDYYATLDEQIDLQKE